MKKLFCLILAAFLVFSATGAFAEDEPVTFDEENVTDVFSSEADTFDEDGLVTFDEDELVTFDEENETDPFSSEADTFNEDMELIYYDYDDITIGNPTPLNGQFFTNLWGNATSDTDVRHLVNGYSLITWDSEISLFRFDRSVVSGAVIFEDLDENRTYLLSLYTDLYYSDGTPITAWDYAFSVLFQCNPVIAQLGGHPAVYDFLVGYEDYVSGAAPYISGVRVLTDNLIIFTVKKESLPYFYELSRLAFEPYPIEAIAPGCKVYDEGSGVFIGNAAGRNETLFTAERLSSSILNPATGYLSHPNPVSGPYCLVSYDGVTAAFEINPFYKGNETGAKPRIKRLTYTVADNTTMIDDLGSGQFALLNKVTYSPTITEGLHLVADNAQYTRSAYPRTGLTYFYFNPESELVQDDRIRQAVAYCFDKDSFVTHYVGAFGLKVDGLYGIGQWMYAAATGTMAYPGVLEDDTTEEDEALYQTSMEEWEQLSLDGLTLYELDTDKAASLLEEAGWTLNERGEPFNPETDDVRYKLVNGEMRGLELRLGYQPRADLEQAFADYLVQNLAESGIRLIVSPLDFDPVVEAHNEQTFAGLDLIYLGDNFNISFDPALFFWDNTEEPASVLETNSLRTVYQELLDLSEDMDHTEPKDILGYMKKWIRLQERLTETLPIIPVYTNIYFDFYTRELDRYWIDADVSWGKAIVPARMHSIKTAQNKVGIEVELEYADGTGDLNLNDLIRPAEHESVDYSYGALSRFPAEIREQIPSEYRTVYEFVAASLDSEIEEDQDAIEMSFAFQTYYDEGETVYVLFGIPGRGSDVDWFVCEGTGASDGSISVTLEKEQWEKLVDITFAIAVVSQ